MEAQEAPRGLFYGLFRHAQGTGKAAQVYDLDGACLGASRVLGFGRWQDLHDFWDPVEGALTTTWRDEA